MIQQRDDYKPATRYLLCFALAGLTGLAWLDTLDAISHEQVNDAFRTAALVYGTARGINALVSLLQGTALDIVFVTVSVGEILDPLNDLIERFSDVILIALGSLALQKILLAVVSHGIFNALLTLAAAAAGIALLFGKPWQARALLRLFLVVAFFRFSLSLVVMANAWVDAMFLREADEQRHIAMEEFEFSLREIDTAGRTRIATPEQKDALQEVLEQLETQWEAVAASLPVIEADAAHAQAELAAEVAGTGFRCRLSGGRSSTCPDEIEAVRSQARALQVEQLETEARLAAITREIDDTRETLSCMALRQRGEKCSFWDHWRDVPNPLALRAQLEKINAMLGDFAENCIKLLVSLLLKSIAIPLLFFYLLLQVLRKSWRRLG